MAAPPRSPLTAREEGIAGKVSAGSIKHAGKTLLLGQIWSAVADAQQAAIQLSISAARSAGFFIGETNVERHVGFSPNRLKARH
jgi:hypothetical protein